MNIKFYYAKLIEKFQIPIIKESKIHKNSKVASKSSVYFSTVEKYSYIGKNCLIIKASIGRYNSIANNVIIGGANHPLNWASTSPVFHEGKNILGKNLASLNFETSYKTLIGNDVWIGSNALIKGGIEISDGAVIGMGSIVTKNVGPYEVWAGNPAKFIKKRFSEEIIKELLEIKWWNLKDSDIKKIANHFNDVETLINQVKEL